MSEFLPSRSAGRCDIVTGRCLLGRFLLVAVDVRVVFVLGASFRLLKRSAYFSRENDYFLTFFQILNNSSYHNWGQKDLYAFQMKYISYLTSRSLTLPGGFLPVFRSDFRLQLIQSTRRGDCVVQLKNKIK